MVSIYGLREPQRTVIVQYIVLQLLTKMLKTLWSISIWSRGRLIPANLERDFNSDILRLRDIYGFVRDIRFRNILLNDLLRVTQEFDLSSDQCAKLTIHYNLFFETV